MTDESIAARKFADRLFDYTVVMAENDLEDILHEQLLSPDFDKFGYITWDDYDRSLELYGAVDGLVLPEALVQWLWDQGFSRCWTNHENQTQTYYVSPKLTGHNYEQSPHRAKVVSAASEKRTRNSKLAAENAELRKALASPEVLRASSGSRPSEAMRAAYIELRDAFGDHDRFDTLLSKYAEACTAMGVAIASFRAPMISLDAVAAEPSGEAQDQSTRHTQGGQDEFDAWRQS